MDPAERLTLHGLVEDPDRWEAMIRREIEIGKEDPSARALVEAIYCDEDRDRAFERFRGGTELRAFVRLLGRLGIGREQRICEIGGGGGWLGWALHREGFRVEMLEPNPCYITGTGYLRTRRDAESIRIWNDLDAWYASPDRYDVVLTHNCVHHFRGTSFVAASIRKKLVAHGRWLMSREWYADGPDELYRLLATHPYSQKYGLYEFPYPATHYVGALEFVGFALEAVVPSGYDGGVLEGPEGRRSIKTRLATRLTDEVLERAPATTAWAFRLEAAMNKIRRRRTRRFSRPAAMLFRRVELEGDAQRPPGDA